MDFINDLDKERDRLAQTFIELSGASSEEDALGRAEQLIQLMPDGDEKSLGTALLDFADKSKNFDTKRRSIFHAFFDELAACPDDEIDAVSCSFLMKIAGLNQEQSSHASEAERYRGILNALVLRQQHDRQLETNEASFEVEREKLADLASLMVIRTAQRAPEAPIASAPPPPYSKQTRRAISAVLAAYCENQRAEGSWTAKTDHENRAIHTLWLRIVGDMPIDEYGFEQHRN